ncbi:Similar to tr/Q3VKM6/Q3VKM6_9CHLB Peptidase C1A [Microcystis aeruginosa PCC 9432]|jgi:C1A family cysteine protease|uniref:Cysteine protease n=3 Tax=Microcystis aeruginosa TaxID=1126 RepID=A0A552DRE9_MICAE|nr:MULTISPECIES: C1 family peptidase [Microcystis]MCZ8243238.1 cysteine protease [Microcystis sp. LE19-131.1A]TRT92995.1 MAG: cysteine protease [Microcystis aeruginosa Ma_OC_LR_19540900_S633]TRU24773.1 MAG: cysteine protease [Microcystis aeruginosa Ma_QC_B_20070730_S2]CCH91861.1 Similar to tr/Q3VKM6/Q3VKM6_9CHLB Peptidase C1A [Microcystis aeruginosa PCC 9432]
MSETFVIPAMGWLPDYPDIRDVTFQSERVPSKLQALGQPSVKQMLAKVGATTSAPAALPTSVDLRPWCSPIEDQKTIGSCTAHAGVGLVEYFERRAFGKHLDASRLFLYKVTRNLLKWTGDTGAFLRSTMYALTLFGVPPEEYYPYNTADFDKEPSAFCYAFGQSYQAISYYRLDPPGTTRSNLLTQIKTYLANGLPSMFGFTVYSSISQANTNGGKIPYPTRGERVEGGHAIDAVGYDDNLKIKNTNVGGIETTGALLIRNSWGTGWGSAGYGWLPYKYVLDGLATDWWSLIKSEWIDTGQFG